jgi:hypothetical protein
MFDFSQLSNPAVLASADEDTVNNAVMKALLANGKRINPTHYDKKLSNADITVILEPGLKLSDYDVVSFWWVPRPPDPLGHVKSTGQQKVHPVPDKCSEGTAWCQQYLNEDGLWYPV